MREAVIVEALRTPIARGKAIKGALSAFHPAHLLAKVQEAVVTRAGLDPADVEQIIGGCVTQAGEQAGNLVRNAWLSRGKGWRTGGTTIDTQCGSGQQANHLISALVKAGIPAMLALILMRSKAWIKQRSSAHAPMCGSRSESSIPHWP
jgi:acetyl-CoA C-acetyltransferase